MPSWWWWIDLTKWHISSPHNEPEFEMEVVLKSRQLRGREWEYLVKWKGYHQIEASWVNESDMEHAQEAIEEFHTKPAKKRRRT
jgi:hypothetical protein